MSSAGRELRDWARDGDAMHLREARTAVDALRAVVDEIEARATSAGGPGVR